MHDIAMYLTHMASILNAIAGLPSQWFLALETIFSKDLQKTKERDFKVKGKVAGSLISVGAGSGNYTYLQIEEAGHMVNPLC